MTKPRENIHEERAAANAVPKGTPDAQSRERKKQCDKWCSSLDGVGGVAEALLNEEYGTGCPVPYASFMAL